MGLAGIAGVAATGVVVARNRRAQREVPPDELRERLHERLAAVGGDEAPPRAESPPPPPSRAAAPSPPPPPAGDAPPPPAEPPPPPPAGEPLTAARPTTAACRASPDVQVGLDTAFKFLDFWPITVSC